VTWRDEKYSPLLTLPAGGSVRLDWKGEAGAFAVNEKETRPHSCGIKDFREDKVLGPVIEHYGARNWSSGAFTYSPDFAKASDLADVMLTGAEVQERQGPWPGAGKGRSPFSSCPCHIRMSRPPRRRNSTAATANCSSRGDAGKDPGNQRPAATLARWLKQQYDVWLKVEFPASADRFPPGRRGRA